MLQFASSNGLEFEAKFSDTMYDEVTPWSWAKVGTCHAFYGETETEFDVYGVGNIKKNNGHFNDLIEWLEYLAAVRNKDLFFLHFENESLKRHMINRRGYKEQGHCVVKHFRKFSL